MHIPVNPSITICAVLRENLSSVFPTRFDTNEALQPLKMARGLRFKIKDVEGLYYLSSEDKVADQLLSKSEISTGCTGWLVSEIWKTGFFLLRLIFCT